MDPNSPLSRMERTMWTVWGYISGAVTRFLRSQPAEVTKNELDTIKESPVNSESSKRGHAQADTSVGRAREEQSLSTVHVLRSSTPGVAWEVCTTEINLGSDEEDKELRRGNESSESESVEGMREEQSGQTGECHAGLLVTDDTEENEDTPKQTESGKFCTCGPDETAENDEEHVNAELGGLTEDAVLEGMEKSDGDGAEERTVSAVTLDDHHKLHETIAEIQVTEDERQKDEEDLEDESSRAKMCTFTEEDSLLREEAEVQRLTQRGKKNSESALELASENESKQDEGTKPVGSHLPLCDEVSDMSTGEFFVAGQDERSENNKVEADVVSVVTEEDISDEGEEKEEDDEEEVEKYINDEVEEEDISETEQEKYINDEEEDKEGKEDINEAEVQKYIIDKDKDKEHISEGEEEKYINEEEDKEHISEGGEEKYINDEDKEEEHINEAEEKYINDEDKEEEIEGKEEAISEGEEEKYINDKDKEEEEDEAISEGEEEKYINDEEKEEEHINEAEEKYINEDEDDKEIKEEDIIEAEIEKYINDKDKEEEHINEAEEKCINDEDKEKEEEEAITEEEKYINDEDKEEQAISEGEEKCINDEDKEEEEAVSEREEKYIDDEDKEEEHVNEAEEKYINDEDKEEEDEAISEGEEEKYINDEDKEEEDEAISEGEEEKYINDEHKEEEIEGEEEAISEGEEEKYINDEDKEEEDEAISEGEEEKYINDEDKEEEDEAISEGEEEKYTNDEDKEEEHINEAEEKYINEEEKEDKEIKEDISKAEIERYINDKDKEEGAISEREEEKCINDEDKEEEEEAISEREEEKYINDEDKEEEEEAISEREEEKYINDEDKEEHINEANEKYINEEEEEDKKGKEEDINEAEIEKYINDKGEEEEDKEDISEAGEVETYINDEDKEEDKTHINETTNNNTTEGGPEQEKNSREVTEIWEEENSSTQQVSSSKEAAENTQHHKTELADKHDAVVSSGQTTAETDSSIEETSEDERSVDKDQVEEERLSCEVDNKGGCMEKVCTTTSVTVNPEGESEQEISGEFKNIPLRFIEGQTAVSQELNTQVCEETQEGIPEYNNELRPDENTTQWYLERGNCEEIHISQLPEEEESKHEESFKNKGTGACLMLREHLEKEQDCTEESERSFDLVVEEHGGTPQLSEEELCAAAETQESGHSLEEREVDLSESSMKTEIKHLDKEYEAHVGSAEEAEKVAEELQDGTEVAKFRMDDDYKEAPGDGCETNGAIAAYEGVRSAGETLKSLEAEEEKMTELRHCQESVYAMDTEQSISSSPDQEEINEFGFLKYSVKTEPKLLDDSAAEIQDVGVDTEEKDCADEEEKEGEMQDRDETTHLRGAGMAAELITGQEVREKTESELSLHFDTQEMKNQSLFRAFEMNETEITDTEAADESKTSKAGVFPVMSAEESTKHVTQSEESYREETSNLIPEHQDVIDEDILDLWIETAMSEDTAEQHISDPEPPTADLLNEDPGISEKEMLMELNSGGSKVVSETETSSFPRSAYLDQSFSEPEQLKLTSTSSLQGIQEIMATAPEFSASSSESQDVQMEQTAETLQSYLKEEGTVSETGSDPDSGVSSPEKSEGKPDEGTETETEVAVRACRDTEEADLASQIKMSPLFHAKMKNFEDEHLEATMSDSSVEIKLTESGQCKGDSEASLEECSSHGKPWTDSEMKTLSEVEAESDDVTESSPELSGAEVAEEQATKSEDHNEVDSPVLDFTVQRSRIAVKNPRIRPPTNPRSLLHMPSADPTPPSHVPVKMPVGVPLGGLGIGIKLPGLGAGLPVLKKTRRAVRDEDSHEAHSQEPEKKEEEKSDAPKREEAQPKPRWMPPGHPGFGNPLMSELKSKLKKTPKE